MTKMKNDSLIITTIEYEINAIIYECAQYSVFRCCYFVILILNFGSQPRTKPNINSIYFISSPK